jgi:hypothetical protein
MHLLKFMITPAVNSLCTLHRNFYMKVPFTVHRRNDQRLLQWLFGLGVSLDHFDTWIVGLNPSRGMDGCPCLRCTILCL